MNKQIIFFLALIFYAPLMGARRLSLPPMQKEVFCSPCGEGWEDKNSGTKCLMPLATIVTCVTDCVINPFIPCIDKCTKSDYSACPPPPLGYKPSFCVLTAWLWGWDANPTCERLLMCDCSPAPKVHAMNEGTSNE